MGSSASKVPVVVYVSFTNTGGMAHYVESLRLAESVSWDKKLAIADTPENSDAEFSRLADIYFVRSRNRLFRLIFEKYNPFYYKKFARKITNNLKPEIVHITSYSVGLAAFVNELKRLGVCVVYTMHDPVPHEERRSLWGWIQHNYRLLIQEPIVVGKCEAVHVHVASHIKDVRKRFGESAAQKCYRVNHGGGVTLSVANGKKIPPEVKSHLNCNSKLRLLFFGRLEPYKGIDTLIDTMRRLEERGRNVFLTIAGPGDCPVLNNARNLSNLLVINRFIEDAEIAVLFTHADLVVLPYLTATQTGVIPLAYAFKKPVIASEVGGLPDLVKDRHTGWLVKAGDIDALTETIQSVLDSSDELAKLGDAGFNFLQSELSWNSVGESHVRHYEALLGTQL